MRHQHRGFPCRQALTGILLIYGLLFQAPFHSFAQAPLSKIMYNGTNDDAKGYSLDMLNSSEDQILAGTIYYGSVGATAVHFLNIDASGTIQHSKIYRSLSDTGYFYRAVDIEASGTPDKNFILCQGLYLPQPFAFIASWPGSPIPPYTGTPNKDRIRVMIVEDDGDTVNVVDVMDNTIVSGYNYNGDHMYPTSMAYNAGSQKLYICGYLYQYYAANSQYSFGPDFTQSKKAFVLELDVNSSSPTYLQVTQAQSYDWVIPGGTADYDIAMRIKFIQGGGSNGDLFVTGSYSERTSPSSFDRSGTMNLHINPNNLASYTDNSFAALGFDGYFDFGVDLVTAPGGNKYIIGNHYFNAGSGGSYMFGSLDPEPWGTYLIQVDMNTLAPLYSPTTAKRFSYSGVWSLNALQTDLVVSDDQFLLCGLTMYPYPGNSDDPSVSNISPVMVDIETNGTSYAQSHISVFLNNSGTGNPASNYNSYYTQGWGVSNIAWNPVFADRWGLYPNNIYLTAPKWENGILAFKWKKLALVGTSGYEMPTDCGQYFTEPEFFDDEVIQPCTTAVTDPLQLITIFNGCDTASLDMTADDCSASDYKPSVVSAEKTYYKPELYPNPAQNTLEVKGLKKDATYTMIDVNGRRLLSGKLSTYNSDIDISQLPAGMYLLELNENKKIMRMKFLKE